MCIQYNTSPHFLSLQSTGTALVIPKFAISAERNPVVVHLQGMTVFVLFRAQVGSGANTVSGCLSDCTGPLPFPAASMYDSDPWLTQPKSCCEFYLTRKTTGNCYANECGAGCLLVYLCMCFPVCVRFTVSLCVCASVGECVCACAWFHLPVCNHACACVCLHVCGCLRSILWIFIVLYLKIFSSHLLAMKSQGIQEEIIGKSVTWYFFSFLFTKNTDKP